ncbi:MAG TPA: TonB-dependent receptor, partial [Prolixibacteraceae bacterium]|nr:TonB-dependent receptor [Prolixibacteraceae bacterium]
SLELYYKKMNHLIEYKNGASLILNPALEADLLDASGYNCGAELYIRKNSGRLTGWLSYALSTSQRRTNGTTRESQVNENRWFPSSNDQPHSLNMVGNYHISKRWRFSWTFTCNTGRPVTLPELKYTVGDHQLIYYSDRNKYRLPDYHRLDVAITCDESLRIKKFWKGSWTFSVINLYGRKNKYSVFFQRDPSIEAGNNRQNSLYALYIIGRPLPALTYNFTF